MRIRNTRVAAAAAVAGMAIGIPSAGAVAHHLITGADIQNGTITSANIKDLSLHARDFDKKVQQALKRRAARGLTVSRRRRGSRR